MAIFGKLIYENAELVAHLTSALTSGREIEVDLCTLRIYSGPGSVTLEESILLSDEQVELWEHSAIDDQLADFMRRLRAASVVEPFEGEGW